LTDNLNAILNITLEWWNLDSVTTIQISEILM